MFKDRLDRYQILTPKSGISLCKPRSVGRPREGDSSSKLQTRGPRIGRSIRKPSLAISIRLSPSSESSEQEVKPQGDPGKILRLAIPVSLESVFQMGFNVIDQVIVGLMGADAVAAVGLSNSIRCNRCRLGHPAFAKWSVLGVDPVSLWQ
jgi:hypothetical protein